MSKQSSDNIGCVPPPARQSPSPILSGNDFSMIYRIRFSIIAFLPANKLRRQTDAGLPIRGGWIDIYVGGTCCQALINDTRPARRFIEFPIGAGLTAPNSIKKGRTFHQGDMYYIRSGTMNHGGLLMIGENTDVRNLRSTWDNSTIINPRVIIIGDRVLKDGEKIQSTEIEKRALLRL